MNTTVISLAEIQVEVRFKQIKNLHLSVYPPDGRVTVASPEFYDLEKVKIYLATKLSWIKKERKKIREQAREAERLYITKESHHFLGKRYLLELKRGSKTTIILKHSKIELWAPDDTTVGQKRSTLYRWYKRELIKVLSKYIAHYEKVMQIKVPKFQVRKMKTKWGSCATESGNILFNVELAKKPVSCIEYVVVHELVHLFERNHNKNFVMLMNRYMPNWRMQKALLNQLPL